MDIAFSNKQFSVLRFFDFMGWGLGEKDDKGWLPRVAQSLNTEVLVSFAWNFGVSRALSEFGYRGMI